MPPTRPMRNAQHTQVRVISLPSAAQRRAVFSAAAAEAGLEWSFFDALWSVAAPLVDAPDEAMARTGRLLRPGEVGCYASHFQVWREFLASDARQLLAFEDDVAVDWPAIRLLAASDLDAAGVHLLKLYNSYPTRQRLMRQKFYSDHSHLVRIRGYSYGTQAYLLTRTGAQALLRDAAVLNMPVDWTMARYWSHGCPVYAVMPSPVLERMGTSTIGHPPVTIGHPPAAMGQAARADWRHLAWRCTDRLRRAWVDLRLARQGLPGEKACWRSPAH